MANMSYCRWENTSRDLDDCVHEFIEWEDIGEAKDLSSAHEVAGFFRCLDRARELVQLADANPEIIEALEKQREEKRS